MCTSSIIPTRFLIASPCQLPASRPASSVHPRKGGGQMEKTHNTEGLGSENISMFFSNSIANKKGFLPRPARFRAWTSGAGREAGSWQKFAVETGITGARTSRDNYGNMSASLLGNVTQNTISVTWISAYTSGSISPYEFTSQQTMANETRPSNISVPVIVYLGLST